MLNLLKGVGKGLICVGKSINQQLIEMPVIVSSTDSKPIPVDPPKKWSKLIESNEEIDNPAMTGEDESKEDLYETVIDQDQLWKSISEILGTISPPPISVSTPLSKVAGVPTPTPASIDSPDYFINLNIMISNKTRPVRSKYIPRSMTVNELKNEIKTELELFPKFLIHLIHSGKKLDDKGSTVSSLVGCGKLIYAVVVPPKPDSAKIA